MTKLRSALAAWDTPGFNKTLKTELENLSSGVLPLAQATTQGGMVDDSKLSASVTHASEQDGVIEAKVAVFFYEIVGGCSCGDEPIADNAYCELKVRIDKQTANTSFDVIWDTE